MSDKNKTGIAQIHDAVALIAVTSIDYDLEKPARPRSQNYHLGKGEEELFFNSIYSVHLHHQEIQNSRYNLEQFDHSNSITQGKSGHLPDRSERNEIVLSCVEALR